LLESSNLEFEEDQYRSEWGKKLDVKVILYRLSRWFAITTLLLSQDAEGNVRSESSAYWVVRGTIETQWPSQSARYVLLAIMENIWGYLEVAVQMSKGSVSWGIRVLKSNYWGRKWHPVPVLIEMDEREVIYFMASLANQIADWRASVWSCCSHSVMEIELQMSDSSKPWLFIFVNVTAYNESMKA